MVSEGNKSTIKTAMGAGALTLSLTVYKHKSWIETIVFFLGGWGLGNIIVDRI